MSQQPSQPIALKGKLGKIAGWCAFLAALIGGVALFSMNVLSIKENVLKLFAQTPVFPVEITMRDVRGSVDRVDEHASITIESVLEKKNADGESECEAGLLTRSVEYAAIGHSLGVSRQLLSGFFDGWFFPGSKIRIKKVFDRA